MPQRHHQGPHSTNNLKSNANNGNNTRNSNAHNPTKMRPPQPVTRGISPKNATGVLSDLYWKGPYRLCLYKTMLVTTLLSTTVAIRGRNEINTQTIEQKCTIC